jgi:hypothetical protein
MAVGVLVVVWVLVLRSMYQKKLVEDQQKAGHVPPGPATFDTLNSSLREISERLTELGKFRVVPADDLTRFGYDGDLSRMESDFRNLARHGLVEQKTIECHSSFSAKVLCLTKDGHWLLERAQLVSHRATYHGVVKPI